MLFSCFLAVGVAAQSKTDKITRIEDLSWLVGQWVGEGFGGVCEEVWLPVSGGTMAGTFKLTVDGVVSFYELMVLVPDSTGPVLLLRHFNPDLTAWEEKDEVMRFPLRNSGKSMAEFEGLRYERTGDTTMVITIDITHKDSPPTRATLNCSLKQ